MSTIPFKKSHRYEALGVLLGIAVCLYSLWFGQHYIAGDQYHYHLVYDLLAGADIKSSYDIYIRGLSSRELVHFGFVWLTSNIGFDKITVMAVVNGLLGYVAFKGMVKIGGNPLVVVGIVCSNYYFHVLYFAAERLKFAMLFLFVALLVSNRAKMAAGSVALGILAHAQALIIMSPVAMSMFYKFGGIKFLKKQKLTVFISLLVVGAASIVLREQIMQKLSVYISTNTLDSLISGVVKLGLFFLLAVYYSKEKIRVLYEFLPLVIAVALIGGERVNLIGYFIFLFYALKVRGGVNFGVLFTSAYFLYTAVLFSIATLRFGSGF